MATRSLSPVRLALSALTAVTCCLLSGRELDAQRAASAAVPQQLRLVTPEGHGNSVIAAEFSADGRWLLTVGFEGTARLWEVATGREIQKFTTENGEPKAASISRDGRAVVIGAIRGGAVVEVSSGRIIHRFNGQAAGIRQGVFSPDGRVLVTANGEFRGAALQIWQAATGDLVRTLSGHSSFINAVAVSPDGRLVASSSEDGTARIWDATTGEARHVLRLSRVGDDGSRVAFSSDGRWLFTRDSIGTKVWQVSSGRQLQVLLEEGWPPPRSAVTGDAWIAQVDTTRWTARVWDAARRVPAQGFYRNTAKFSPDGRLIVVVDHKRRAQTLDAATGQPVQVFQGYTRPVWAAAYAPNGNHIATATDSIVRVIESSSGRETVRLIGHRLGVDEIEYSHDGQRIITSSPDQTARVWDATTGRQLLVITEHQGQRTYFRDGGKARFSNDRRAIVTAGRDSVAKVWDAVTGRELLVLRGHAGMVWSAVFSPDGSRIATAGADKTLRIWDSATGRELSRIDAHGNAVTSVEYSHDGRYLVSASIEEKTRVWEARTGRMTQEFPGLVDWARFAPGDRYVLTGSWIGPTIRWDVATGRELSRRDVGGNATSFTANGRHQVQAITSEGLLLSDVETGAELLRYFEFKDDGWLFVSPDGRFDGAESAIQRMHYASGTELIEMEAFFDRFFTPGLSGLQLAGAAYNGNDIRRGVARAPEVRILSPSTGTLSATVVTVAVQANDRGGGVEDVRLYHNGARVNGTTRGVQAAASARCPRGATCFELELLPGSENRLVATAFSRDRTEAAPAAITIRVPGTTPTASLYVLAVGIDSYENPRYNLNYGRKDASAFVDSLRLGSGDIYAAVHVETLYDRNATRGQIESAFSRIAARAKPEDVFVFYYAGHGVVEEVNDSTQFFLVPSEVTQLSSAGQLERAGISGVRLQSLLESVPARKKVMVLDACHSGEAVLAFARRGAAEERALAQLARSSGLFVLSATDSEQFASEVATLGHGVLTYALLSSLGGTADGPRRPRTVRELMTQVEQMVPDLSRQHRSRVQYPMVWSRGMDFPLVVR